MAGTCEHTTRLLREHLRLAGLPDDSQAWPWVLARSPLGGRGVIATRDIAAGELVFYDVPLVLGPRAGVRCPPLCVGCHQGSETLVSCSRGCGLPVCSTLCEDGSHHVFECQRLRSWGVRTNGSWSDELLRAVIPVRCLSLSPVKRQVLQCLQSHCGPEHAFEVCRSLLDAAKSGDVNTAKILFKYSNDNCTDDDKYRNTPLIVAARFGHVDVVRVLLEVGANVSIANAYRYTALHVAACYGHVDVCRLLLDWGAKVDRLNKWKDTPLHIGWQCGDICLW